MEVSSHQPICPECGTPRTALGAGQACPVCALRLGLETDPSGGSVEWSPGKKVGRWRIESLVGKGGSGEVFLAHHELDGSIGVIKALSPSLALDDTARFRFQFEANHRLVHPGIVPIVAGGEEAGRPYHIMPFYPGGSLDQWIASVWKSGSQSPLARLPGPEADDFFPRMASVLAEIARAVSFAHSHGWIHRDLKPSNILLDSEGNPAVADFGASRRLNVSERISNTGVVCGSPEYLPPEIASGRMTGGTTASDIYGIGAILFEVLSGGPPYSGPNVMATLQRIAAGPDPVLHRNNPRVPKALALICQTCLARDPGARYRTALEVAEDLERFVRNEPLSVLPKSPWNQLFQWAARNRLAAGLALACVVILAITTLATSLEWRRASLASEEQRSQVVGQWIGRGIDAVKSGQALSALPWFVAAWRSDARGGVSPERLRLHQHRFLEAARNLPVLEQVRSLPFPIRVMATSHDGRWAAAAGSAAEQGIAVWSTEDSHGLVRRLETQWPVVQLSFSGTGNDCFAQCLDNRQVFHLVSYEISTGKERFSIALPDRINSVETSPDGRRIAFGCRDGSLQILEPVRGSLLDVFRHQGQVRRVAWLSSNRLASVGWDDWVRVWDLDERRQIAGWDTGEYLREVMVSPKGDWMVFAGDNRMATLVDPQTLRIQTSLMHPGWVIAVAASNDGRLLATGDRLGNLRIWEASTGRPIIDWLNTGGIEVRRLAFSADDQMLGGVCIDKTFRCWRVLDGQLQGSILPMEVEPYSLQWATSNRVLTITASGTGQLWSMRAETVQSGTSTMPGGIQKAITSASGEWVALHLGDKGVIAEPRSAGATARRIVSARKDVVDIVFRPGTHRLFVADRTLQIKEWDLDGGRTEPTEWTVPEVPAGLCFGPTGQWVACATRDGQLQIRGRMTDAPSGAGGGPIECETRLPITGPIAVQMRSSPDGRSLLVGVSPEYRQVSRTDVQSCLFIYDVPTRRLSAVDSLGFGEVVGLEIAASGDWAAVSGLDGGVRLIRLDSGSSPRLGPLLQHPMAVTCLEFDRGDGRLFTGGYDQTIRAWEVPTGRLLRSDLRFAGSIRNIALNPDGTMLFIGSESGPVGLWDSKTLEPISMGPTSIRSIRFCALSGDGRNGMYGGSDRRLYQLPLEVGGFKLDDAERWARALAPFEVDESGRRMELTVEESRAAWTRWRGMQERPKNLPRSERP